MPEPTYIRPYQAPGTPSSHKGTPRRCRINHKYKYLRANYPLAFEQPLPGKLYRSRSEMMEDGGSVSSGSAGNPGSSSTSSSVGEEVLIRIHVPELKVEKCLQFHKDDLVWEVKHQAMATLPKELKESFNYGLFCPPQNGRAGKFLDEERPLMDYPFSMPVGYLELKYKRRVYKMLHLDEKSLRALHTKASTRRFLEFLKENNVEKVSKLCVKGLDPNFHCHETGETPLTMVVKVKKCCRIILALVNGGAILDYRSRDGLTPMHKAVQADNFEALRTLLDLGASPNYRDLRGLTPLYFSVTCGSHPMLCEALLHEYANIGSCDNQGWQETHQACRNKLVQHLENLLFYGAEMNAQNASGNTPLHVCAVNNLEDCARVLLFRGCDKNALNYANQTPYQVAVIAGNMELAQVIQKHSTNDVVQFKEPPRYNSKRRVSGVPLFRALSDPKMEGCIPNKPPSPSLSNRSIPPFSSASSLSETSTGSGSTCTHPSEMDSEEGARRSGGNHTANENSDIVSDSSGVCTSNSGSNDSYDSTVGSQSNNSTIAVPSVADFNPGMLVVCLKQYSSGIQSHLIVNPGEILEVTGSTDEGLLECCLKGRAGLLPPNCVQEVRLRDPKTFKETVFGYSSSRSLPPNVDRNKTNAYSSPNSLTTTYRNIKNITDARTVVLHRGKKGFGFVLRGAKATSPLLERPFDRGPALQYLDDVDPGGVADEAGLKKGDFLLIINDEDVSQASHEHVVNMIKKSGDLVKMVVLTPSPAMFPKVFENLDTYSPTLSRGQMLMGSNKRGCQTLPRKFNAGRGIQCPPPPPPRDPKTTLSVGRARARSMVAGLQDIEAFGVSMLANEESCMSRSAYEMTSHDGINFLQASTGMNIASIKSRPSAKPLIQRQEDIYIGRTSLSSPPTSPSKISPRVYASVAEMKKAKAMKIRPQNEEVRMHKAFTSTPDLQAPIIPRYMPQPQSDKRKSLSQENIFAPLNVYQNSMSAAYVKHHANLLKRQNQPHPETEYELQHINSSHPRLTRSLSAANAAQLKTDSHLPPGYPPPAPPSNIIKVDICRSASDYATVKRGRNASELIAGDSPYAKSNYDQPIENAVVSSFRPSDSAKLYASPQEINSLGYRESENDPNQKQSSSKTRSQSLPPATNRAQLRGSLKETPGYAQGHLTFRRNDYEGQPYDVPSCCHELPNRVEDCTYARPKSHRTISDYRESIISANTTNTSNYSAPNIKTIPEPDYSSDDSSRAEIHHKKVRTLKKKKPTVSFANDPANQKEEPTNEGSQEKLNKNNFAELIAQKAAERNARKENGANSSASPSENSSPNPKRSNGPPNGAMCLSDAMSKSDLFNRQRLRSIDSPLATSKTNPIISTSKSNHALKDEKELNANIKGSHSYHNEFPIEDGDNSSSGVSSDQEHIQPEPSYVTVINTQSNTVIEQKSQIFLKKNLKDDSSEASESSDESSDRTWILTNEKCDKNDSGKDSDSSSCSRRSGNLTKNAVSLVKLPPPQEVIESEVVAEKDIHPEKPMLRSADQDTISTVSSLSSMSSSSYSSGERYNSATPRSQSSSSKSSSSSSQPSVLHYPPRGVGVRRNERTNTAGRQNPKYISPSLTNNEVLRKKTPLGYSADAESINRVRQKPAMLNSRSATLDRNFFNSNKNSNPYSQKHSHGTKYDNSIEESLQLIRMHMDSLNEVNTLAGIGGAKKAEGSDVVLAPPPEFSDASRAHQARREELAASRTVIHISADEEADLPVQFIRQNKIPGTVDRRSFRNKYLSEWTTKDTTDWLESLFMPEYKASFNDQAIDGCKLMRINNDQFIHLGIRKMSHRVKIEKSLKRYRPVERIDL